MVPNKKNAAGGAAPAREAAEPAASFEQALERLETIVEELESGSLSLEDSIARYEEGIKLSRRLTLTLNEAEKRIERLLETQGGDLTTTAMELDVTIAEVSNDSVATRETPSPDLPNEPRSDKRRKPSEDIPDELPF